MRTNVKVAAIGVIAVLLILLVIISLSGIFNTDNNETNNTTNSTDITVNNTTYETNQTNQTTAKKSSSKSNNKKTDSDIESTEIRENYQAGDGSEYKQVNYKDGNIRQYDSKGKLIGSSYESDQSKLKKEAGDSWPGD